MARIVLVDDNVVTLKRWESLLAPRGHEVLSFSAAEPALQMLSLHPTSLIVLDLAMPVHSGYDLMKTLRSQSIQVPILVVSGKNNQEDINKALSMGASDYIVKPFDDDIFVAKVDLLLASASSSQTQRFAEAVHPEATTISFSTPQISVSEMGFWFQSAFSIAKGTTLHFASSCLEQMELKDSKFRVSAVTEIVKDGETQYKIFVSFVGLSQTQLTSVRLWIRQNQLKYRRPA